MKILQVQFKNRNGHTLRGIVTLPDTEGKVPFVVARFWIPRKGCPKAPI